MDSLHPPCTTLKKTYDACFNHWFEEYLQLAAPIPSSSSSSASPSDHSKADEERQAKIRSKAAEYDQRCGKAWKAYRECLEEGLEDKDLKGLIREAREEFPLQKPKDVNMNP